MKRGLFRIVIITCLLATTSLVFGGAVYAQDEGLPGPGITPDSPFYIFDKWGKSIGLLFTFGNEAKASKALEYAGERLSEAQAMAVKNRITEMTRAAGDYEGYMAMVNEREQEATRLGASDNISERVALATSKHLQVLDEIKNKVPEKAREAIAHAREASTNGQINALRALAKNKPERAMDISSDAIQKVLDRARIRATGANTENETSENVTENEAEDGNEVTDNVTTDNVTGDIEEALDYAERISELEDEMVTIAQEKGIDVTAMQQRLAHSTSNRLEVLSGVYEKAPAQARQGLENAIENSVRKYERAVDKLQKANTANVTSDNLTSKAKVLEKLPEKVRERLETKNSANATSNATLKANVQSRVQEKVKEQTEANKAKKD